MTMDSSQDQRKNKTILHVKASDYFKTFSKSHDQDTVLNNVAIHNHNETI